MLGDGLSIALITDLAVVSRCGFQLPWHSNMGNMLMWQLPIGSMVTFGEPQSSLAPTLLVFEILQPVDSANSVESLKSNMAATLSFFT